MSQKSLSEDEAKDQSDEINPFLRNFLPPANPIITKNLQSLDEKVTFKIEPVPSDNIIHFPVNNLVPSSPQKKQPPIAETQRKQPISPMPKKLFSALMEEYRHHSLIYRKFDNQHCNKRDNIHYLTAIFLKKQNNLPIKFPEHIGTVADDQLEFDSNFDSGNLMLVYKKGENVYDLLLQNDMNTGGHTQWYNFKVHNKRHNFIAKFNIVNLYKSDSLYNKGMKPCVNSEKSDKTNRKAWRRKGFNISYELNQLFYEDNHKKQFKSLTFQYDFTVKNDTVQFAHSMPYDLTNLKQLLDQAKACPKVTIHSIGYTYMGKSIPAIRIKSIDNSNMEKKIIVIQARQHPGQTVGSFIAEEIVLDLLRNSSENQFLTWRYDIYIIPMVNMDGVEVGNYRGNFTGFDLNRCWERTDPKHQPQVQAIKSFIKKLKKKQQIELILDLHGHSRKMGSFFYGNNFGKNSMLFPYVASKLNSNILFEQSRFSSERGKKAETARVVLGKMIKDTGNVYTYEVSFFGNYKNGTANPFSFNQNHYRDLGKALVLSMYRTYMQIYKQQKTLKESIYLKSMKQQLQQIKQKIIPAQKEQSGSDSEAEQITINQTKKIQQFYEEHHEPLEQDLVEDQSVVIKIPLTPEEKKEKKQNHHQKEINDHHLKLQGLLGNAYTRQYYELRNIIKSRFPALSHHQVRETQQQLQQQLQSINSYDYEYPNNHAKNENPHRLKVYGETYQLRSRFDNHPEKDIYQKKQESRQSIKYVEHHHEKSFKDLISRKKSLRKSLNTISQGHHKNISLSRQLQPKENKIRNRSLQLKEVTPMFDQQLTSNNIKPTFLKANDHQKSHHKVLATYISRALKLPQL